MHASSEGSESAVELEVARPSLSAAGVEVGHNAALAEDSSCSSLAVESRACSSSVVSTDGVNALREREGDAAAATA